VKAASRTRVPALSVQHQRPHRGWPGERFEQWGALDQHEYGRKSCPSEALVVGVGLELALVLTGERRTSVVLDKHAVEPRVRALHVGVPVANGL
jgi:hypothetical protein